MIISGTNLSKKYKEEMRKEVVFLKEKYGREPHLAVVLVGDNAASLSYVKNKDKGCAEVGIKCTTVIRPESISENELLDVINELNNRNDIDGILVQLPLPKHINEKNIISAINVEKDVDGFHPLNVAGLWQKQEHIIPCTPKGIIRMLKSTEMSIEGKHAVILGRSNIVGLPISKLLLDENATVTIAHSKTKNLKEITKQADILVVAIGKLGFVTSDMVKDGCTIIDVGINRDPNTGKIKGDVNISEDEIINKNISISPVPGGVGPMTICCLLENTIECFNKKFGF